MTDATSASPALKSPLDDPVVELSARRTGMSFQRTRLSAERTLMSVIRTSISLVSFGFTIFQFFQKLRDSDVIKTGAAAPRHFGQALVWFGIGLLIAGILYHLHFMRGLRRERAAMRAEGLIHADSAFPPSYTLWIAIAFLILGIIAILSMTPSGGPLG